MEFLPLPDEGINTVNEFYIFNKTNLKNFFPNIKENFNF